MEAALAPVVVVLALVLAGACYVARGRRRRRRDAMSMYVVSRPGIELEQRYGGWNAEAYDVGTGHGEPFRRAVWHSGPPSTWARLP